MVPVIPLCPDTAPTDRLQIIQKMLPLHTWARRRRKLYRRTQRCHRNPARTEHVSRVRGYGRIGELHPDRRSTSPRRKKHRCGLDTPDFAWEQRTVHRHRAGDPELHNPIPSLRHQMPANFGPSCSPEVNLPTYLVDHLRDPIKANYETVLSDYAEVFDYFRGSMTITPTQHHIYFCDNVPIRARTYRCTEVIKSRGSLVDVSEGNHTTQRFRV